MKAMRSRTLITLLTLGVAACSDIPVAPTGPGLSPDADVLMSKGSGGDEGGVRTFVVNPGERVSERFGNHKLTIPADAVCDPETSGYGADLWDQPCEPIRQPIEVTATWSTVNGNPAISFSPDLRFVPSDDPSRWVQLSLKHTKGVDEQLYYSILWRDQKSGQWVDESAQDLTARARPTKSSNKVARRLKHFSDYYLWVGLGSYNVTSGLGGDALGVVW